MARLLPVCTALLLLLGACAGSGKPGGGLLYDEEGRLLDSEIRMETYRPGRNLRDPDLRVVSCRDGVIRGRVDTRYKEGEADFPIEAYGALWRRLESGQAGIMDREPPARDGGLYHLIRIRRGTDVNEFSAQERTNFLGVGTSTIYDRVELANAIAEAIGTHVPTRRKTKADAEPGDGVEPTPRP